MTCINPADIIGFTRAPDGRHFLNLKDFRQVLVSREQWLMYRKVKQQ